MIRVLAPLIVPPHMSVSGGARAGEQLSFALAQQCRMSVASMLATADVAPVDAAGVSRVPVRTWLPPGLPWSRLPQRYRTLFYRSDIPDRIRPGAFDLIHLHNPMPALEMERVARAARRAGIPYLVSTHGFNEIANGRTVYGFDRLRGEVWRRLVENPVRRVVRGASAILALSPADFSILDGMGYQGPIHVASNGVAGGAAHDPEAEAAIRHKFNLPACSPDTLTCLFLANHTPNKGLPILLEAFRSLTIPYRLIVAGDTRPEIDYAAWRSQRPDQHLVVTGRLADADVAPMMRSADLFVFPTLADTLPLVVLEAMAEGIPVLASAIGGIPYQLEGGCGVLVPPGDAPALAEAVARIAANPAKRAEMGSRARARVAQHFTWEAAATNALRAYEQVLAGQPDWNEIPLALDDAA
ncbi:glycosyltransferase family 4 protein [Methylobacterium flocculans]|uniref:glycosyltransferase family 4 protein n=1 Tax=Methylobacterium flocculans TaxID=2984843 RepID=UPI0021F2E03F|nr:glycosyltransferase family 4 protein [Methylobacterium sp. FF17]